MEADRISGTPERLIGKTTPTPFRWTGAALMDRSAFEQGLRSLGLPEADLSAALEVRDEVAGSVAVLDEEAARLDEKYRGSAGLTVPGEIVEVVQQRASALERLGDWFKGRRLVRLDAEVVKVDIPLFYLTAPDVSGCSASFATTETQGRALTWEVTVLGTGLGGGTDMNTSAASTFTADGGETKVVFIPTKVTVSRVAVQEQGEVIAEGFQVEGAEVEPTQEPGLVLLPPGSEPTAGDLVRSYPLAGDTTGAIASYEYTYERSNSATFAIGLKAFNVEFQLKASVEVGWSFELRYGLRGGHDYELHRVADKHGLVWAN